ncbi:hypothetical protein [Faecalibacter sp. LW9]|uniref:hypothetical protein n=1 Tax=Faecalibacter sp. LW9 TaxID=3103144 RepID=UPI002AFF370B|nr:hypothetical protein [Faecalibacter sp. LW9]
MKYIALILGLAFAVTSCTTTKVVEDQTIPTISESQKIIAQTLTKTSKFNHLTI